MPRLKRRTLQHGSYTALHVHGLLTGFVCFDDAWGGSLIAHDPAERDGVLGRMKEAWRDLRSDLVKRYVTEFPGRRPWAYWRFDRGMDRAPSWGEQPKLLKGIATAAELARSGDVPEPLFTFEYASRWGYRE